jgi:hypothetical protein
MRTKRAQADGPDCALLGELGDWLTGEVGVGLAEGLEVTFIMLTIRAGSATGPAAAAALIIEVLAPPKQTTDPPASTAQ